MPCNLELSWTWMDCRLQCVVISLAVADTLAHGISHSQTFIHSLNKWGHLSLTLLFIGTMSEDHVDTELQQYAEIQQQKVC